MSETNDEVLIRVEGTAGRITLNRPKALNALTLGMVRAIWPALRAWKDDPAVELVILDGAGERGLCAGGDVRWLYDSRARGLDDALAILERRPPLAPGEEGLRDIRVVEAILASAQKGAPVAL